MTRAPRARTRVSAEASAAPAQPLSQHRKDAELEAWVCRRLALRDLFAGATDSATRAGRLRAVLIERDVVEAIAGSFEGKTISYREIHKRLYGEDLA